ncbi:ATPase, T2SS/T4P/T4SS family [Ralstonia sp. 1138]
MLTLHKTHHDERVFAAHMDPIAAWLADPCVIELLINGPGPGQVIAERQGSLEVLDVALAERNISGAYKALAAINDRDHHPILDCRMPGMRVAMVMPPIAVHGPAMAIRKHARSKRSLRQYLDEGLFTPNLTRSHAHERRGQTLDIAAGDALMLRFLHDLMVRRDNFILAGSTSAGKTSLLNAMIDEVPRQERLIVLEDTTELQLERPNYLQLEANPDLGVSVTHLVRLALRLRPDRIFVGEVRGADAYDLMDALNTGHSGSGASYHSDSPEQALPRLESMIRQSERATNWPLAAMRAQITATFRYVIFCSKEAGRAPESIVEILGLTDAGEYRLRSLYSRFAN